MTNLKDINFGINQYCGPAVLSALTGESTDKCASIISSITGKTVIRAVEITHLKEAFKRLRFDVEETNFSGSTLYGVLHRMHNHDGLYVVFVPEHVVAIEVRGNEIYICDNHSKTPLDIKQSARLMQKVHSVIKVTPKSPPVFIETSIELTRHPNSLDIKSYSKYKNPDDDIRVSLGYLRFKNDKELEDILYRLHCYYESNEFNQ